VVFPDRLIGSDRMTLTSNFGLATASSVLTTTALLSFLTYIADNNCVNVMMIGQNVRFKAILSHSDAFSTLLWVADPLKHIERSETTFYIAQFYTLPYY
jgi:hypothetical protein